MHDDGIRLHVFLVLALAAGCGGGGNTLGAACVDDTDCGSGQFCNSDFVCEARPTEDAGTGDAARDSATEDSSVDSAVLDSAVDDGSLTDGGGDAGPECGDGVVSGAESCDTAIAAGEAGACPSSCDDGDFCTTDSLSGEACTAACDHGPITAFVNGDLCCPSGASSLDDTDCAAVCGNGLLEGGEACDTTIAAGEAGACPTIASCDDSDFCTTDSVSAAGSCDAACAYADVTAFVDGDMCCPPGGTISTDSDCVATCGDGVVSGSERCDTAIASGAGVCPTTASCDDGDPCTTDGLRQAGTCNARCRNTLITTPTNGDMCCPAGANQTTDSDCAPVCGNSVIESGETCDDGNRTPGDGCDASCQIEGAIPPTAFRMTDLDLREPHIYVQVPFSGCRDLTDRGVTVFGTRVDSINKQLQDSIQLDGDGDGLLDLSFVVVFRPLEQAAASGTLDFYSAACTAPAGSTACSPGGDVPDRASYTNQTSGTCLGIAPMSVRPYSPAVATPGAPCFVTAPITIAISLGGGVTVPLENAQIAASYVGAPASDLSNGLLRGFLTEANADATLLPASLPVIGGDPLSSILAGGAGSCTRRDDRDDLDGDGVKDGWWFYLNFPATEVPWAETP
ncbi:MAG: DUF4215 domain-containing protein [Deltaproteobacteria bacterium]|nr:DUF4215 domain-containing protein [Deltaproteobacteria bacterium]